MNTLSAGELVRLIKGVFPKLPDDRYLGILVDFPRELGEDNEDWIKRRQLAYGWFTSLSQRFQDLGLHGIRLIGYPDVGSNNAEFPEAGFNLEGVLPATAAELPEFGVGNSFADIFNKTQLFLAMTEYSATAPLKNAARKFGFRAATMPGFSEKMIPALRIDYNLVNIRVGIIKEKLDRAVGARVIFDADGQDFKLYIDLRFRSGHASSGQFPDEGTAGNLPSGEAYIVPYEGEDEVSRTEGVLPVQIEDEIVKFVISQNRAIEVLGEGPAAQKEREHLKKEPAYGNIAELGFGILGDFRLKPIGEILLDEKLGLHIAFGRSDHFGGIVSPDSFSSPEEVIHLDRIYIPETQPLIKIVSVELEYEYELSELLISEGKYRVF